MCNCVLATHLDYKILLYAYNCLVLKLHTHTQKRNELCVQFMINDNFAPALFMPY